MNEPNEPTPPLPNEFFHPHGTAALVMDCVLLKIQSGAWDLKKFSVEAHRDKNELHVMLGHHPPGVYGILRTDPEGRAMDHPSRTLEFAIEMRNSIVRWLDELYAFALAVEPPESTEGEWVATIRVTSVWAAAIDPAVPDAKNSVEG